MIMNDQQHDQQNAHGAKGIQNNKTHVEPASTSMDIGETEKFVVVPTPASGTPITWTVSGNAKGKIDAQGEYTAVANGTDAVTAKDANGNVLGTATVTVS